MSRLKEQYWVWRVAVYKDQKAFDELYNLHHKSIYQFLIFRLGRREDAEDLAAQAFMKSWEYLIIGNKDVKNFRAFMYRLARNLIVDFYRNKKNQGQVSLDESDSEGNTMDIVDVKDLFEQQMVANELEQVIKALGKLKQEYREAVTLKHLSGLKVKEIAEVIGKTNGATAVLIHRGMQELKKILQEFEKPTPTKTQTQEPTQ